MLTTSEKESCKQLLGHLSTGDLISLSDTVTKKLIKVQGRAEAIEAIVIYTESPLDLLKRKKMKKETLFQYLVSSSVHISPASDKRQVILAILKFWGCDEDKLDLMDVDLDSSEHDVSVQADVKPLKFNFAQQTSASQAFPGSTQSEDNHQSRASDHNVAIVASGSQGDTSETTNNHVNQSQASDHNVAIVASGSQGDTSETTNNHVNQTSISSFHTQDQAVRRSVSELQKLGETFVDWFYKMLNSQNPTSATAPQDFGPHHFWDEVRLSVSSETDQTEEIYSGSEAVSKRLLALSKEECILFNPNVCPEGVFVKSSRHGLVMVMVCGTIHRNNDCLGIFQQVFGIIKDPRFDNNWKIKVSKLMVKCERVTSVPKLTGNLDTLIDALVPAH